MKRLLMTSTAIAVLTMLAGCDGVPAETSTQLEHRATEQQAKQAAVAVGSPAIINFAEKRQLKMIFELRDQANLVTYTYRVDMNGHRHSVCPTTSVGFGIPYATQYTNPQMVAVNEYQHGVVTLPQADPNALFSPASADATWVICLNPKDQSLAPVYEEPKIEVYIFEMPHID